MERDIFVSNKPLDFETFSNTVMIPSEELEAIACTCEYGAVCEFHMKKNKQLTPAEWEDLICNCDLLNGSICTLHESYSHIFSRDTKEPTKVLK